MCHRAPGIVAARTNFLSAIWFRPDCGSLSCPECLEKYKQKHIKIVCSIFEREQSVWKTTGTGWTQYDTVCTRIRRSNGFYVAIEHAERTWTIYSTVCAGEGCWLTDEQAIADIVPSIMEIQKPIGVDRYRPITYSKAWRIPKPVSTLFKLGFAVASTFKEVMHAAGVAIQNKAINGLDLLFGKTNERKIAEIKELLEYRFDCLYWDRCKSYFGLKNKTNTDREQSELCRTKEDQHKEDEFLVFCDQLGAKYLAAG